jgi:hypothetical protein
VRRKPLNERSNNLLQEGAIEVCKNEIILDSNRDKDRDICISNHCITEGRNQNYKNSIWFSI